MTLDRHAAERRRFARLLGVDDQLGCGLPIGSDSSGTADGAGGDGGREGDGRADGVDETVPDTEAERSDEESRETDAASTGNRPRRARR